MNPMKHSHPMKVKYFYALMFVMICLLTVQCKTSQNIEYGLLPTAWPKAEPDHIILTVTDDLSTSVAVTWRTSPAVSNGFVELSVAGHGPEFPEESKRFEATTQSLTTTEIPANYHSALLSGLEAGETYVYRVGNESNSSEWIQFTTAVPDEEFSFIYFGDAQNDIKSMWSRVIREAYTQMPKASFMLHAGDLINRYNSDTDWNEWFEAGSFIHSMIPAMMTPGNHEYRSGSLSPQWGPQFSLPQNGPDDHKETCYFFHYNNTLVISLNSMKALRNNESVKIQADWLRTVLEENTKQPNAKWIVVTLHHPLYATKAGRDNDVLREYFQPLFEQYDVDLVLQGHDHAYGRGHNVPTGSTEVANSSKTVYVVSVSGPKMYELDKQDWMSRKAKNTQLFQLITVGERPSSL